MGEVERCYYCGNAVMLWCDWACVVFGEEEPDGTVRLQHGGVVRTCDRPVCDEHGFTRGRWFDRDGPGTTDTIDYCQEHHYRALGFA